MTISKKEKTDQALASLSLDSARIKALAEDALTGAVRVSEPMRTTLQAVSSALDSSKLPAKERARLKRELESLLNARTGMRVLASFSMDSEETRHTDHRTGVVTKSSRNKFSKPDIVEPNLTALKARQAKGFIEPKRTEEKHSGTIAERLAKLDEYVQKNPSQSIAESVQQLFPELAFFQTIEQPAVALPKKAPALWSKDKRPDDNPPSFIKREYAPWLGQGLSRADIRRLDTPLYLALAKHVERHGMPDDLDLATAHERNDRWLKRVQEGPQGDAVLREMRRVIRLIDRRKAETELS